MQDASCLGADSRNLLSHAAYNLSAHPLKIQGIAMVFDRPIFILAAPRTGSTMLFETLQKAPDVWTVGGESHALMEGIPGIAPGPDGVESNRLDQRQATEPVAEALRNRFQTALRDREGQRLKEETAEAPVRMLEKTPKNSLRVPFLNRIFPGALFIFLYRDPTQNLGSIMDAWQSGKFVTYPRIQTAAGPWSLLLPPGWKNYVGRPLADIAAFQWGSANKAIITDLAKLDANRWTAVSYEEFVADPKETISRLCKFCGIEFDKQLQTACKDSLPLSRYTLTKPSQNKWRRYGREIIRVLPHLMPLIGEINEFSHSSAKAVDTEKLEKLLSDPDSALQGEQARPGVVITESLIGKTLQFTLSARGKKLEESVFLYMAREYRNIPAANVDSLYGFVEQSTLYGGRPFERPQLSANDLKEMAELGIGLRLPLTNLFVTRDEYEQQKSWLEKYHRKGNSVIVALDDLARWIREDFPEFQIEASVIKDVKQPSELDQAMHLYDTVVLPMRYTQDREFLKNIPDKSRIRLFTNAGCALNCPSKICYPAISRMNKYQGDEFKCSQTLKYRKMEGMVDFDLHMPIELGFRRFKVLRGRPGNITGY